MRKSWYKLVLLGSTGLLPNVCLAQEVIATTAAPSGVVASSVPAVSETPVAPLDPPAPPLPIVNLGRPRVAPPAIAAESGILPVTYRPEETPPPALPLLEPEASRPAAPPRNEFAADRVAMNVFEAAPAKPPAASDETLKMPRVAKPSEEAVTTTTPHYTEEMFEESAEQPPFRLYGSAEYLAWWTKDADVPPLATTSTDPNRTFPTGLGFIGSPNTIVLNDSQVDQGIQHGARFRLGYRLPTQRPLALEASYFFLCRSEEDLNLASDGNALITRPFFNGSPGTLFGEFGELVTAGPASFSTQSPLSLQGADLNLRTPLGCATGCGVGLNVDLFAGFRWLRLRDGVYISEQGMDFAGTQSFFINDRFDARNTFYGAQLGAVAELRRGRWSLEGRGSLALGWNHQVINVNGSTVLANANGTTQTFVGGLLALPSNIGQVSRNRFSVVPEIGLTLGYNVTDWMKVTAGYNFIFWSNVVRAGDQIDRVLDVTQIPGFFDGNPNLRRLADGTIVNVNNGNVVARPLSPPRPVVPFKETTFWAQGATLGLELRY